MERLLTPAEVADRLQNTQKTLNNWRALGIGPAYVKMENGSVRYRPSDVEKWLTAQVVQPSVASRTA
jgi:predicted DNA-binding transcriptional regulator AlpA